MFYYVLLGIGTLLNVGAQVLLKVGAKNSPSVPISTNIINKIFEIIFNPYFLGALVCYGFGFILYFVVLTQLDLSKASPISSVSMIVLISLISAMFLGENISILRMMGLLFCCVGILLIFLK